MKIPIEWLKQYINTDKTPEELAKSFTLLGLMQDKPFSLYENGSYKTVVLDLEHRMDRSDWLSIIGCARDLSAFEGLKLKLPKLYTAKGKAPTQDSLIDIKVLCSDVVNRFNTVVIKDIKVIKSPPWLRNRLEAYGIPSINNIVDVTNYVMVETGQPMHAQDTDKMKKPEIVIRRAENGEQLTTLLGETLTLTPDNFVLTQADKATVLGGIVGGIDTGIDENTKNIVLDAGNYNQNNIRKNSRRLKIQNETVLRYDKYLHPELTEIAINRAVGLILRLAGGEYYENMDWYPNPPKEKHMTLHNERIKKISGMEISNSTAVTVLKRLGYRILSRDKHCITVSVPIFRTDIEVEDDLISDILRIGDYTNIPSLIISAAPPDEITPEIYNFEDVLRDICVSAGMQEQITEPLIPYSPDEPRMIKLENSQSSEKNALRTSVSTTLKKSAEILKKRKTSFVRLFEIGKIYLKKEGSNDLALNAFEEIRVLDTYIENTDASYKESADSVKILLRTILRGLGVPEYKVRADGGKYLVESVKTGNVLGGIRTDGFYLFTEALLGESKNKVNQKYRRTGGITGESAEEDISVIIPNNSLLGDLYQDIIKLADNSLYPGHEGLCTFTVLEAPIGFGADKKNLLISLKYPRSKIEDWKNQIIGLLEEKYSFIIRK